MKKTFKLFVLSGIAICGLAALAVVNNDLVENHIQESTIDEFNQTSVMAARNATIGEESKIKVSKTFVQLGQKDDLLVLRFATAVSGSVKSVYYTRTCEGLGTSEFEITTLYQGISSGQDVLYYDDVLGQPTTSEEFIGQYYWACYVVAFETDTYKASDFNVKLTVVGDEEEVDSTSRSENLYNVIAYEDITTSFAAFYNGKVEVANDTPYDTAYLATINKNSDTTKNNYAGYTLKSKKYSDFQNKKLEFDFKPVREVYKNRIQIDLLSSGNSLTGTKNNFFEIFFDKEYDEETHKVESLDNGWFHVTVNFPKLWALDSYVADHIRLQISNQDTTADGEVLFANFNITNYNLFSAPIEETPDVEDENLYDYSDDMQNNYNTEISLDKEVNYDGVQSAKIVGSGVSSTTDTAGAQTHIRQVMNGKVLSFYVKFDGNTCRKNRVTLDIFKNSTVTFNGDTGINVTLEESLPNGITMSYPDANGWQKVEMDFDTLGYVNTEVYKIRFIIKSPDSGVTIPTCWIDKINVK